MKKLLSLVLVFSLLFALMLSFGFTSDAATSIQEDQETMNRLEQKKAANAAQREKLNQTIAALQGQYENNYQRKLILEQSIQLADEEISTVESLIAGYESRIEQLRQERYEQQEQLDEYYAIYANILTYYYKYGEVSSLELLLSADSITDFLTRLDYLKYIMEYNNTITDSIKIAQENSTATAELYQEAQSKLAAEKESLEAAKAEYAAQTAELDEINASIENNIALTEKQKEELYLTQAQIEKELAEIAEQIKDKILATETDYGWPIDSVYWSSSGVVITCKWGWRINPITGKNEFHNGLDIAAPKGTPIQAIKSGIVIRSENSGGWGNVITILHGDGTCSLYAHCDKLLVSLGASVNQGQVIARVGTTGQSTGNHLHITIYKDRTFAETLNPADILDPLFIEMLNKRNLSLH